MKVNVRYGTIWSLIVHHVSPKGKQSELLEVPSFTFHQEYTLTLEIQSFFFDKWYIKICSSTKSLITSCEQIYYTFNYSVFNVTLYNNGCYQSWGF